MTSLNENDISQQTLNWIRLFVIEYDICPFAKHVVDENTLSLMVSPATDKNSALNAVFTAIDWLDSDPTIETLLLIFPFYLQNFYDYLDFVDLAEDSLALKAYEGIYQLATFHPHYCFAGVNHEHVSNYTNRSPYPMLHFLRETSVEKAIYFYGNTEQIPENNIRCMEQLGLNKIKQIIKLPRPS